MGVRDDVDVSNKQLLLYQKSGRVGVCNQIMSYFEPSNLIQCCDKALLGYLEVPENPSVILSLENLFNLMLVLYIKQSHLLSSHRREISI